MEKFWPTETMVSTTKESDIDTPQGEEGIYSEGFTCHWVDVTGHGQETRQRLCEAPLEATALPKEATGHGRKPHEGVDRLPAAEGIAAAIRSGTPRVEGGRGTEERGQSAEEELAVDEGPEIGVPEVDGTLSGVERRGDDRAERLDHAESALAVSGGQGEVPKTGVPGQVQIQDAGQPV